MRCITLLFLICSANKCVAMFIVPDYKSVLDLDLYERVLDPVLCEEQINYLLNNDTSLLIKFLDAGIRTPKGILNGNLLDLGNYYQCLDIYKKLRNSDISGKYCMINLPLKQAIELPKLNDWPEFVYGEFPWQELNPNTSRISSRIKELLVEYNNKKLALQTMTAIKPKNKLAEAQFSNLSLNLAICLPKACSTQKVINLPVPIQIHYEEIYCRLPNDKPWVVGDYVALLIFSLIGFLTILSTAYDLYYQVFLQLDRNRFNKVYQSFSVYTNTRRLVTYTSLPGAIECLDGIRTFAMMWVIVGHTFAFQLGSGILANPLDVLELIRSPSSIWITAAPITVDTFFMLSGLLLVYTTAGKFNGVKLVKNIHLFYLNRIFRMFPVLAAMILIQVSILNWIVDGPYWTMNMQQIQNCRVYWWSTLLYVQNYVNPSYMCLPHSWYLAIDIQLYMISPLILFWVLNGKRKTAWTALVGSLLAVLAASTAFNFVMDFVSAPITPARRNDLRTYFQSYYVNTLTRASPFLVGMIVGYLMHIHRELDVVIQKPLVALLWVCSAVLGTLIIYSAYPIVQMDWDNQLANNFINSFMRPAWAAGLGWLVFACHHGYGGPINWFLSLNAWKIPSRLSYAMYIVHVPLMILINAMSTTTIYFSLELSIFSFFVFFSLSVVVAFLMSVFFDAPCSTLLKCYMGEEPSKIKENVYTLPKASQIENNFENAQINGIVNEAYSVDEISTKL